MVGRRRGMNFGYAIRVLTHFMAGRETCVFSKKSSDELASNNFDLTKLLCLFVIRDAITMCAMSGRGGKAM